MENLKRQIILDNAYNVFAKKAIAIILPQLTQFVGKKIFTANGDKAKIFSIDKSAVLIDKIEGMTLLVQNCYLTAKNGKLKLILKIAANGGNHDVRPSTAWCKYVGIDFDLGLSNDGQILDSLNTLEDIINLHNLNSIINFDEEIEKIKVFRALEKQAETARRNIKVDAELYKYL